MSLELEVRRTVRAPVERVFAAWIEPDLLRMWWGPVGVTCAEAHVDARPGGEYRIANRLPDGKIVWIFGIFEEVEAPRRLVYSWHIEAAPPSRVTVQFEAVAGGTEVAVRHERIADEAIRESHAAGWGGCLDGLVEMFGAG